MKAKPAEERIWNSSLLTEAIGERFKVSLGREAVRMELQELGYAWKRSRYASGKQADPELVAEHRASLETLKRVAGQEADLEVS
jgi:transposase